MALLTLSEHGLILRGGPGARSGLDAQGRPTLSPRHFEQLRRMDERLDDPTRRAFEWLGDAARASQWVGVVQLPGLAVEILPKAGVGDPDEADAARRNLLHMLQLAGDVPTRERDEALQGSGRAPLSETLMAIFAERLLAALLLGRERSYDERRGESRFLRGKLMFGEHLRRGSEQRARFFVERAELIVDTPLNRALKASCRVLLGTARMASTQETLRHCLLCLQDVPDAPVTAEALERIQLPRQSARFAPLLAFCQLVLAGRAPTARAGAERSFSILFDMNVVFERFVAAFIRRHVMPSFPWHELHVHARHHWRYLLRTREGRRGVLRLEPDLLFARSHDPEDRVATLDTKWKRLDQRQGRRGVAREDLYQLFAYAQRYACPHNILLYPQVPEARPDNYVVPMAPGEHGERTISVRFINLERDLRAEREALAGELRALLTEFLSGPPDERPIEI